MTFRKLQAMAAVAAVTAAAAGATEAGAATPLPGVYTGQTGQGNGITIKVERLSSGMSVRRVAVKGTAECDYGLPAEDVSISRLVLGGKVRLGRFSIPDSDMNLRGRFVTRRRIEGKIDLRSKFSSCETEDISYHAIRR
jgi:hypothetical protein